MKTTFSIRKIAQLVFFSSALTCGTSVLQGCTENIDESNFQIKTEQTVADYIDSTPYLSQIKGLFQKVKLGDSERASSIYNVLTTRGNYTLFLPTNDAMEDLLMENGVTHLDSLSDEMVYIIATSCIIDNGTSKAYSTADFPIEGAFKLMNLSNRLLTCKMTDESVYIINGKSKVIGEGTEVSNGYVHIVDRVIAPSINTLDKQIDEADNLKVFSYLLKKTSWADSLYKNLDLSYENPNRGETLYSDPNGFVPFYKLPRHRFIGYTALVETDSVYEEQLGLKAELDEEGNLINGEDFLNRILPLAENEYGTKQPGNYTHTDNAINRFVAYHLLDGKIAYNMWVHHYNEYHYNIGDPFNPQLTNLPVNVWDYYTTKGPNRCILKVTQVGDTGFEHDMEHTMYLNRISNYADGPEDDYRELSVEPGLAGVKIFPYNGDNDNNALNGFYYPIDKILFYTGYFRRELYKRRMRVDYVTCLPEMFSNNLRGSYYTCFESGYFDNIVYQSPSTQVLYEMQQGNWGFNDFQGDGIHFTGSYDYTVKLPPVPHKGTYELRLAGAHGAGRGMVQIYFGDNPHNLLPAGLPYDMRPAPGPKNPAIPWIPDTDDWVTNRENDKNLRIQGYMKGPNYITIASGDGEVPLRKRDGAYGVVRRIIVTADMDPNKTYYLRFKTALRSSTFKMQLDYIEYASTAVFNGSQPEDIW